jgi:hypothetical protein
MATILQQAKFFNAIPPGVKKDNAAFVSNVLDKQTFLDQGAKGILFLIQLGVTDKALAVLKVMQSDTKSTSTALGGTPTQVKDVTVKPSATDDGGLFGVYLPLAKWVERFLALESTAGDGTTGTYMSALAIADFQGDGAATAAALGLTSLEIA